MVSFDIENDLLKKGYQAICGVDEAGRGPLAGPVTIAGVVLPKTFEIEEINDSKKISDKKRRLLFERIKNQALAFAVVAIPHNKIDEINILQAALLGMKEVINLLCGEKVLDKSVEVCDFFIKEKASLCDYAIIDGNKVPDNLAIPSEAIVKGDAKSCTIACASILAKVTRDDIMQKYHEKYPEYSFDKHKGYGTKLHREAILSNGVCPIHRASFLKKILPNSEDR